MQAAQPMAQGGRGQRPAGPSALSRAIRYLGKQRRTTFIAYGALIIATLAQLVVPLLLQNMINTATDGAIAKSLFDIENPLVRAGALGLPLGRRAHRRARQHPVHVAGAAGERVRDLGLRYGGA